MADIGEDETTAVVLGRGLPSVGDGLATSGTVLCSGVADGGVALHPLTASTSATPASAATNRWVVPPRSTTRPAYAARQMFEHRRTVGRMRALQWVLIGGLLLGACSAPMPTQTPTASTVVDCQLGTVKDCDLALGIANAFLL